MAFRFGSKYLSVFGARFVTFVKLLQYDLVITKYGFGSCVKFCYLKAI